MDNFIVFEGLDGAGTTTQAKRLKENIEKLGRSVYLTHEPTDNPIGRLVRQVLQHKVRTTPRALALLYSADRDDHLYNAEYGIIDKIRNGEIVISDRYFYSSLTYQKAGGVDQAFLEDINAFPSPEAVIFLDTPVEECLRRIEKRGEEKELFDEMEYLSKVRSGYIEIFSKMKETELLTLDGRLNPDVLEQRILAFITEKVLSD